MKKSYVIALVATACVVLWFLSGVFVKKHKEEHSSAVPAQEAKIPSVRIKHLKAEDVVNDVSVTGRTQASRTVELRAEIDGVVTEIKAVKGGVIKEDDLLALLEQSDRKARLEEAQERVKQREIEYKAAEELEAKGFNSKVRRAEAAAELEAARAQLTQAQEDFDNTTITAPFEGVVHDQLVEIGDFADRGDHIFTIVDLDPLEITGYVTEHQVSDIILGATARVMLLDGRVLEGRVTFIAPAAHPQTRTFLIEISVPNKDNAVPEGMTARIAVPLAKKKAHKISPSIISLDDKGRVGVKIVDKDDKVEFAPVTILGDAPGVMWVDGLPDAVRIITVGQEFVLPGQKVNPVLLETTAEPAASVSEADTRP